MHSQDTINHFIELRARSIPYSKIAGDLNITKATAVRWGHKYRLEIDALVAVEAEALRDRFFASREKEIEFLAKRLQRIEHEMTSVIPSTWPRASSLTLPASPALVSMLFASSQNFPRSRRPQRYRPTHNTHVAQERISPD